MTVFAVCHRIPKPALDLLAEYGEVRLGEFAGPTTQADLASLAAGASGVLTMLYDHVDGRLIDEIARRAGGAVPAVVANVAVGYDNIDVGALAERGVVVTNTPGVLTDSTADLAVALILAATRRLGEGERLIRSGAAWAWDMDFMLGTSLRGKRLGIVGAGQIGQAVARRAAAFGMEIVYTRRARDAAAIEAETGARRVELDELISDADVISLHVPLSEETHHLIGEPELHRMKSSAYLVNTSRGPVVDERALVRALERGEISGAGLDVYENEPAVEPGLATMENTVLVPHLGSATVETRTEMALLAARNAIEVCMGREAITPVEWR